MHNTFINKRYRKIWRTDRAYQLYSSWLFYEIKAKGGKRELCHQLKCDRINRGMLSGINLM